MTSSKTSVVSNGLIWFGAGVSIAEILTGALIAPLGWPLGLLAIFIGHVLGGLLLYGAGLIGGLTEKSAMETVGMSFGQNGMKFFSGLNVLQLVGWTAVMLTSAADAAHAIFPATAQWLWPVLIGGLIAVWVVLSPKALTRLNVVAMIALMGLTVVLCGVIANQAADTPIFEGTLSFGAAVELSIAMPLSWLPLIADYTRRAKRPRAATAVSCITYSFVSIWMYAIGLGAALFAGESDISAILMRAGLGVVGLLIVIFSTVTTTFLDVYSAGVSSVSLWARLKEKPMALLVCGAGTLIALVMPTSGLEDFLYLIGSVFAPMTAILLMDFFILKKETSERSWNGANGVLWAVGFVLYRISLRIDTPIGNTVPVIVLTMLLTGLVNRIRRKKGDAPHVI